MCPPIDWAFDSFFPRDMAITGNEKKGSTIEQQMEKKINTLKESKTEEVDIKFIINWLINHPSKQEINKILEAVVKKINVIDSTWKKAEVDINYSDGIIKVFLRKVNWIIYANVFEFGRYRPRIVQYPLWWRYLQVEEKDSWSDSYQQRFFNKTTEFYKNHLNRLKERWLIDEDTYNRKMKILKKR